MFQFLNFYQTSQNATRRKIVYLIEREKEGTLFSSLNVILFFCRSSFEKSFFYFKYFYPFPCTIMKWRWQIVVAAERVGRRIRRRRRGTAVGASRQ